MFSFSMTIRRMFKTSIINCSSYFNSCFNIISLIDWWDSLRLLEPLYDTSYNYMVVGTLTCIYALVHIVTSSRCITKRDNASDQLEDKSFNQHYTNLSTHSSAYNLGERTALFFVFYCTQARYPQSTLSLYFVWEHHHLFYYQWQWLCTPQRVSSVLLYLFLNLFWIVAFLIDFWEDITYK